MHATMKLEFSSTEKGEMEQNSSSKSGNYRHGSGVTIADFRPLINRERRKKFAERGILIVLIIAVIAGIFAPLGILMEEFLNIKDGDGGSFNYKESCGNNSGEEDMDINAIDLYQDQCIEYGNGICGQYLELYSSNLSTLQHITISEDEVAKFIEEINSRPFVTPECKQNAIPFICQYVYPPCITKTSYQLITREECVYIENEVCTAEWLIAKAILSNFLPDCKILNSDSSKDDPGTQQNESNEIFCIDQFDTYCNELCVPSCEHFSQYDKVTTSYRNTVDVIAAIIGLIGGSLFIIIAVRRRQNLLEFPAVLVFYMTLCPMIIGLLLLITRMDGRRVLYCTHDIATDTLSDPSLYCQLSGAIFHFLIILMGIFWFLHLCHVYLNILFPIQLNFLNRKTWSRGLHVTEVTGAIIVSTFGPMAIFISGSKYNTTTLPPIICFPASTHLSIYTMFMPLVLMFTIGVCIIITMLWTLIKKNTLLRNMSCYTLSVPEIKILILTVYFITLSVVITTRIALSIEYLNEYFDHLYAYFFCQLRGDHSACAKLKEEYEKFHYPHLTSLIIILLGSTTCVNLIFAIKAQDVKDFCSMVTRRVEVTLFKAKSISTNDAV